MNFVSLAAVFGALMWIASDLLEVATGGFTTASLLITLASFCGLAAGVWGIAGTVDTDNSWRIVTGIASLGFALMAAVTLQMLMTGAELHPESLLFGAAVLVFSVGLLGTGIVSLKQKRHARPVGALFLIASLAALAGNGAEIVPLAVTGNILLSIAIVVMAYPTLRAPKMVLQGAS